MLAIFSLGVIGPFAAETASNESRIIRVKKENFSP